MVEKCIVLSFVHALLRRVCQNEVVVSDTLESVKIEEM